MSDASAAYRGLDGRAKSAVIALAVMLTIDAIAVASDLRELALLQEIETGTVSDSDVAASDRRQAILGVVQTIAFVVTAVFFVRWIRRAYENTFALGAQYPRFSHATAIWSWFVPILNLWRPKQVINDVWRGSDPAAPVDQGDTWRRRDPPLLFGLWWFAWVVLNFAYNIDFRLSFRAETLDELQTSAAMTTFADAVSVVGALLAIVVVRRTTARQNARAASVGKISSATA